MFKADKRLQRRYERNNQLYFHGELPHAEVGWNDELPDVYHGLTTVFESELGKLLFFNISLHPQLKGGSKEQIWLTLIHEQAHIRLYPNNKHGKKFQQEMLRLAAVGALKEIW